MKNKINDLIINNHHFYYVKDDSFSSGFIALQFLYKTNKKDFPYFKILLDILSDSIVEYPSKKDFTNYLYSLYSSSYSVSYSFVGNSVLVRFKFSFPNLTIFDESTKREIIEGAFKTIYSSLTNPNFVKDGKINEEYINKFIDNQRLLELRKQQNPTFEMYNCLYKSMYEKHVVGQKYLPITNRLKKCNYNRFLEIFEDIKKYDFYSIYGGSDDIDDIKPNVEKYFNFNSNSIKYKLNAKKTYEEIIEDVDFKVFEKNIDQSHLLMRFHSELKNKKWLYVKDLFNYILGSSFGSDLFTILREQMGLAYDVNSIVEDNSIIIHMGCKLENINLSINEIKKIIGIYDYYDRNMLDEKLNVAKIYFQTALKAYHDDISYIRRDVDYFVYRKKYKNLVKNSKMYNSITIDDIIYYSKSLRLMNIYVTKPTGEDYDYEK